MKCSITALDIFDEKFELVEILLQKQLFIQKYMAFYSVIKQIETDFHLLEPYFRQNCHYQ